ncbi:cytochrome b/b6 domain-containing protein [Pseudoroseicyclus sp. H15]
MVDEADEAERPPQGGDMVYRHRISTRLWHWVNAVVLIVMLMSGLMIFNAHPALYWGQYGANPDPSWLQIGTTDGEGYLRIGNLQLQTTGVLGLWSDAEGELRARAFPYWATIPSRYSLADARLWHLTFAWIFGTSIVLYLVWSLINRHLWRDIVPRLAELRPSHVWGAIKHHAMLRLPRGEEARHYNVLQKISYVLVIVILIPTMVLSGLTMSPSMNAAWPWLLDLFGGRQSARSVHFIVAWMLVAFIIVHLLMVLLAGPINEIRSMITGRYRLPKEKP